MSLKAVHVVFVMSAILLCLAVGGIGLGLYRQQGGAGWLAFSLAWWACGITLVVYGRRVVRKLRQISYF